MNKPLDIHDRLAQLLDLLDACDDVTSAWESGDLAAAVRELDLTCKAIRSTLPE